jgi:hypothetical protein
LEDLANRAIAKRRRHRRRWLWRQVYLIDKPSHVARICRDVGRSDGLLAHYQAVVLANYLDCF